jgi:rod shape-determining protein MreB
MKLRAKIGVDLGTANTKIWLKDQGLVLNQPSIVAVSAVDGRVLTAGTEASEMVGKTPDYIEVSRPMSEGVVANFEVAKAMMNYFLRQLMGRWWFFGPEVVVAVPSGATEVELRAVVDVMLGAGASKVDLIDEPVAGAVGAKIPVAEAKGNLLMDVGGGSTEVAVMALGGVVSQSSIRIGGDKLDEAIVGYLRKKHGLLVGLATGEFIKKQIGSAIKPKKNELLEVSGRNIADGLPKKVMVGADEIYGAMAPILEIMVETVRSTLEVTPPELVADVLDRGIVLCGEGSKLTNFETLVTREIGVPAHLIGDPELGVIRGIGAVVDNREKYSDIFR